MLSFLSCQTFIFPGENSLSGEQIQVPAKPLSLPGLWVWAPGQQGGKRDASQLTQVVA